MLTASAPSPYVNSHGLMTDRQGPAVRALQGPASFGVTVKHVLSQLGVFSDVLNVTRRFPLYKSIISLSLLLDAFFQS